MTDPALTDVVKQIGDLKTSAGDLTTAANIVWPLITGFLAMFMQAPASEPPIGIAASARRTAG